MFTKSRSAIPVLALFAGVLSAGCFLGDDESREEEVREGLEEAARGLGQAGEAIREALEEVADEVAEGAMVDEPLNFREFYEFLPEEIGDFTRTSREGKTEGAMGWDVSRVEARYENEDGGRITVEIVDLGALPIGATIAGFVDWAGYDVDEENDRGWKRSTEWEGFPAIEEFRRTGDGDLGRADFDFFVEKRFAVSLEGRNVYMDDMHDIAEEIDADDLADMKDREGERRDRDRDR